MRNLLSIDGGGVRGALTACFLVELERQLGKPTRDVFQFVAGTSTGALIAAAVAVGLPAETILQIYLEDAAKIFTPGPALALPVRLAQGYAYQSQRVHDVLAKRFGQAADARLNNLPIRILLTAMGVNGHPWYFVRDCDRNSQVTGGLSLIDCAVASAAAPTYLSPWYVSPLAGQLVGWCFDGGVGTTGNPVYRACVEAFCYDDFTPETTRVISLGTGYYPADGAVNPPAGILATLGWTIGTLLDSPIDEQTQIVRRHWPGILSRFNWRLPQSIDMSDAAAIPNLVAMGKHLAAGMDWRSILG